MRRQSKYSIYAAECARRYELYWFAFRNMWYGSDAKYH